MFARGSTERRIQVHATVDALSEAAAQTIARAARESIDARGSFLLVLSGGETPRATYERLAADHRATIAWDRTHVFFSDERCVPPDDARSNYAMARDTLLARVPIPAEQVHAVETTPGTPQEMASAYELKIRSRLSALGSRRSGSPAASLEPRSAPTFDLALLGVGADGHTASLFPAAAALREADRFAVAVEAPASAPVRDRVTLTLPALNRSRRVVFLVAGRGKREIVARLLGPDPQEGMEPLPAALVHGLSGADWLLDADAGADLSAQPGRRFS